MQFNYFNFQKNDIFGNIYLSQKKNLCFITNYKQIIIKSIKSSETTAHLRKVRKLKTCSFPAVHKKELFVNPKKGGCLLRGYLCVMWTSRQDSSTDSPATVSFGYWWYTWVPFHKFPFAKDSCFTQGFPCLTQRYIPSTEAAHIDWLVYSRAAKAQPQSFESGQLSKAIPAAVAPLD